MCIVLYFYLYVTRRDKRNVGGFSYFFQNCNKKKLEKVLTDTEIIIKADYT
jgi:hypothetical protein